MNLKLRNIPTTWGRPSSSLISRFGRRNIPTTWGRHPKKALDVDQRRNIPTTWGRHLTKIMLYIKILEKTDFL